jgi:hypothetical protein
MSIFLELIPVSEAEEILRKIAPLMEEENVPLPEAYGRVLFRPATAAEDIPGFTRTVVDGYAVRAADTVGAGEAIPAMLTITGRVGMGDGDAGHVAPGECRYVPTGAVIPDGADAAAMIEYAEESGDGSSSTGRSHRGRTLLFREMISGKETVCFRQAGACHPVTSGFWVHSASPPCRFAESRLLGLSAPAMNSSARMRHPDPERYGT